MIENPLLEFYLENNYGFEHYMDALDNLPWSTDLAMSQKARDAFLDRHILSFKRRHEAQKRWSWAVPTQEALEMIAKYSPIVEIGAGSGYWAHLLSQMGVEIMATDLYGEELQEAVVFEEGDPMPYRPFPLEQVYYPIEELSAQEAVLKYPHHNPMFIWPAYGEDWAYQALKMSYGRYCIYVGEGRGGCTADDQFHDYIGGRKEVGFCSLPQWDGLHDNLYIYNLKEVADEQDTTKS